MVDFAIERPYTLQQLAELLPFSYTTLHRWHKYGHHGIKLESRMFPGKVVTSLEAVLRFSDRIAQLDSRIAPAPPSTAEDDSRQLMEAYGI